MDGHRDTTNGQFVEDDLILFAMGALAPDEGNTIAASLRASEELRTQYAEIRLALGLFAASTVDPVEPPAGSLERLMGSVAKSRNVVSMPLPTPTAAATPRRAALFLVPWSGWAIAALMLITAGLEFRQNSVLRRSVESRSSQLQQVTQQTAELSRERDGLMSRAQEEAGRANASLAELSSRSAQLREQADAATGVAEQERRHAAELSAKVSAEASRAQQESARAAGLATVAAANASERDMLQKALNSQQDQLASLGAQAVEARQVVDALSDPQALRVTLTVPKQKKTPTGRGTYVPSRGTLLFAASNLPSLGGGRVYELWLMPTDGSAPIPAGTFTPDASGDATLVTTNFRKSIAAKGFAVTAEPAGGSQTPTMPILLAAL